MGPLPSSLNYFLKGDKMKQFTLKDGQARMINNAKQFSGLSELRATATNSSKLIGIERQELVSAYAERFTFAQFAQAFGQAIKAIECINPDIQKRRRQAFGRSYALAGNKIEAWRKKGFTIKSSNSGLEYKVDEKVETPEQTPSEKMMSLLESFAIYPSTKIEIQKMINADMKKLSGLNSEELEKRLASDKARLLNHTEDKAATVKAAKAAAKAASLEKAHEKIDSAEKALQEIAARSKRKAEKIKTVKDAIDGQAPLPAQSCN
jgi:hypothetical protein